MTVESALEELYASDPSEFTKKRDALAKQLKADGDAEAAAAIKARRKPTQIAWVLNSLARKHPDAIADLVDVGRELAREQRKALRGEAVSGLKSSIERQRKAIQTLSQKTSDLMKELGVDPGGHMDEITSALSAALVDPIVGAQLEEGRLEKAPEAAVGFGGPVGPEVSEAAKPAPAKAAPAKAERVEEARAAKEAKAEEARAAKAAAERAAHAKALAAAKADAKSAEAAATKAQHAAERAEKEAREAIAHAKTLAEDAASLAAGAASAAKLVTRLEATAPDGAVSPSSRARPR